MLVLFHLEWTNSGSIYMILMVLLYFRFGPILYKLLTHVRSHVNHPGQLEGLHRGALGRWCLGSGRLRGRRWSTNADGATTGATNGIFHNDMNGIRWWCFLVTLVALHAAFGWLVLVYCMATAEECNDINLWWISLRQHAINRCVLVYMYCILQ